MSDLGTIVYKPAPIPGAQSPFGIFGMAGGQAEFVQSSAERPITRGSEILGDAGNPDALETFRLHYENVYVHAGFRCVYPVATCP